MSQYKSIAATEKTRMKKIPSKQSQRSSIKKKPKKTETPDPSSSSSSSSSENNETDNSSAEDEAADDTIKSETSSSSSSSSSENDSDDASSGSSSDSDSGSESSDSSSSAKKNKKMKTEHSKEKDGDPNSSTSLSSSSDSSSDSSSADEEISSKSGSAKGYGRKKNKQKKARAHKKNKQGKSELAKAYGKLSNPVPSSESSSKPDTDPGSESSSKPDTDPGSNSSSEPDSNSNSDSNSDSEQDSESGSASNSLNSNSENDSTENSSSEDSATPAVYCMQVKNEITRTLFPCLCTQMCNKNEPCKTNKGRLLLCYYSENKKPTLKAPDTANNEHSEDPIQEMLKGGEKWKTFMNYGMSNHKKAKKMKFSIVENMGLSNNKSCIYIDACFSDDHRLIFSHGKPAEVAGARIYTNTFGPVKEFTLRRIGGPQIQKTQLLPNYYFLCAFTKND